MKIQLSRRFFALAASAAIVLSSSASNLALAGDDWSEHRAEKKQEMMDEFFKTIDATPEQKKQILALHEKYDAQAEPLKKSLFQGKKELMTYVFTPGATPEEAARRQDALEQNQDQLESLELKAAFEKKAVLTPEQQKKAIAFFDEKAEKMEQKHDEMKQKETLLKHNK
jgi:Spy/CpxP family protein refolding chaperone